MVEDRAGNTASYHL